MMEELVRERIRLIDPYEMPFSGRTDCKLDQNESPCDLPGELKERILEEVKKSSWNRYNEGSSKQLREQLAERFFLKPENIIVGVGIDELLYYIALTFLEKKDKVVRFSPSFGIYKTCCELAGALDIEIKLNPNFSLPNSFINEVKCAKLTFICRPNNPTGNSIDLKTMEKIVKNTTGLVCIDEAYAEFGSDNCLSLLKYPNVVILRTFSKLFSAASIRLGYALADESIISYINRIKLPWNINLFSQIAAQEILKSSEYFEDLRDRIKNERERLNLGLAEIRNVEVVQSEANFILFRVPDSNSLFERLLGAGVKLRKFSSPLLKNYLRVSVGEVEENNRFLEFLKRCL